MHQIKSFRINIAGANRRYLLREKMLADLKKDEIIRADKAVTLQDIEQFVKKATEKLENPSFSLMQEIIRQSIDKIVATQKEVQVFGHIPLAIAQGNVEYESIHRNRWFS